MKRIIALILALASLCTVLCSCAGREFKRADETAVKFIEALLIRDEEAMKQYIHPDHAADALPNDEFYEALSEQFLTVGNKLDALEAGEKNYVKDTAIDGNVLQCKYIIRTNELFYDVKLMIVDNGNGYGVAAVEMSINLDYLSALTNGK